MKKVLWRLLLITLMVMVIFNACKNEDVSNHDPVIWNLNATVDLSGTFTVIATAAVTVNASQFSAAVTTSQIAGVAEVHDFTISGTISGGKYNVVNSTFSIQSGGGIETTTITSGTNTVSNNSITGSGSVSVVPAGGGTANPGTYTLTGTY
jgi:hypothetical protein